MKLDLILQIRTVRIQVNAVGMVQALGILLKIGLRPQLEMGINSLHRADLSTVLIREEARQYSDVR